MYKVWQHLKIFKVLQVIVPQFQHYSHPGTMIRDSVVLLVVGVYDPWSLLHASKTLSFPVRGKNNFLGHCIMS